jgi:hypothetical protein
MFECADMSGGREMHGVAKRLLLGFVVFIGVVAFCGSSAFAASTGQIKGRLTDKETGEPVIGASVQVVGTKFGGMSDPDGRYTIARLDPGVYSIRISSVDYSTVDVSDVEVKSDFTVEVNQKLVKRVTELDDHIEVIASKDPIQVRDIKYLDHLVGCHNQKASADG